MCVVEPGRHIETGALFGAWRAWCRRAGRDHAGPIQSFGRDLAAAVSGVVTSNPRRVKGLRARYFEGIDLAGPDDHTDPVTRDDMRVLYLRTRETK